MYIWRYGDVIITIFNDSYDDDDDDDDDDDAEEIMF